MQFLFFREASVGQGWLEVKLTKMMGPYSDMYMYTIIVKLMLVMSRFADVLGA